MATRLKHSHACARYEILFQHPEFLVGVRQTEFGIRRFASTTLVVTAGIG